MAEGNGLAPFEQHGADLGLLEESAAELVRLSNQAIDQEAATMSAFSPAEQGWEGIAAPELRDAPDGVQQDAFEVSSAVAWGSVPLRTWAASVAEFNRRAAQYEAECAAELASLTMPADPAGSPNVALAVDSARATTRLHWEQKWRDDYETYIVDGAETAARMYREGPTEENLRAAGHAGIPFSVSGALLVLPQLWHDANMRERAEEAVEVANRILATGEPSMRDLERLNELLTEYGGDEAFAYHLLSELGPVGLLDLTANVSGIVVDDDTTDLEGRDAEIAGLLGTIQAGLGVALATATRPHPSQEGYQLGEGWEEELFAAGAERFVVEGGASNPYGFQLLGVLLSSPDAAYDADFLNRAGTAMLDFEQANGGSAVWFEVANHFPDGRLNWIDGHGDGAPYGHDPIGGLMVALREDPDAAREFFLTGAEEDRNPRLEYLVNERIWDHGWPTLSEPEPGAMRPFADFADTLDTATRATHDPDAQQLVGDLVRTVAAHQDLRPELRQPFADIAVRWIDNIYNGMQGGDAETRLEPSDVAPFLMEVGRDEDARRTVIDATTGQLIAVLDGRFDTVPEDERLGNHGEHVPDRGDQLVVFARPAADMMRALEFGGSDEVIEDVRADQERVQNRVGALTTLLDVAGPWGTAAASAVEAVGADDSIASMVTDAEGAEDQLLALRQDSVDALMTAYWLVVGEHGGPAGYYADGAYADLYRGYAGYIESTYRGEELAGVAPRLDD